MKILIKLDRFFAWVLFAGMLLYFVSGYGMTKGIIDSSSATKLHMSVLTYIVLIAFTVHASYAIHLALKRWRVWNIGAKFLLITFFAAFFGLFIYVDRYFEPKKEIVSETLENKNVSDTNSSSLEAVSNSNLNSSNQNDNVSADEKTFTLSELAKYDGENGNPAYVAVDGDVYDLSAVFNKGSHYSHYAGTELTNAFYAYHAKSALSKYPIVGELAK